MHHHITVAGKLQSPAPKKTKKTAFASDNTTTATSTIPTTTTTTTTTTTVATATTTNTTINATTNIANANATPNKPSIITDEKGSTAGGGQSSSNGINKGW